MVCKYRKGNMNALSTFKKQCCKYAQYLDVTNMYDKCVNGFGFVVKQDILSYTSKGSLCKLIDSCFNIGC